MSAFKSTRALVFAMDEYAVRQISRASAFTEKWFRTMELPDGQGRLERMHISDVIFLLSSSSTQDSRLIMLDLVDSVLLGEIPEECRPEAFDRVIRAALSQFESSVKISNNWRPFHKGSRISFQSNSRNSGCTSRLLMETNPKGSKHILLQVIDGSIRDLDQVTFNWSNYEKVLREFNETQKPLESGKPVSFPEKSRFEIGLSDDISKELTRGSSLSDWYDSKLSVQQRKFVDFPLDRPVRLRGAAGTGKTLALVVKFVRSIYQAIDEGREVSFILLTHSMATVDVANRLIENLDERGVLHGSPTVKWTVSTLQELANEAMSYDLSNLQPLSNDGLEGRKLQLEAIESVVNDYMSSDWPFRRRKCSEKFIGFLESDKGTKKHRYFCWELMNEFACVLDADGVRESATKRKKYLGAERRKWMMPLVNNEERQVVLELYTGFRRLLNQMNAIGVDQMISDYLGYLDSFRWDGIRKREGYDAVFVDELHLFNRQERMVFQFLARDNQETPVVVMAYDAKQSPRDTFVDINNEDDEQGTLWSNAGLGAVEKIELQEVFRYTPEIAEFLSRIDSVFPAVDFDEEWPAYSGVTEISNGPKPICCEVKDLQDMYDRTFKKAARWTRKVGAGRKVALLTISEELFDKYARAGAHQKSFVCVSSREELANIRYAGKRFIFSRPEYVAGLQFEVVILIDVNKDEIYEDETSLGAKRRFVSEVYLGASRAERILEVYAQKERGGISDVLSPAIESGAIKKISPREAKDMYLA